MQKQNFPQELWRSQKKKKVITPTDASFYDFYGFLQIKLKKVFGWAIFKFFAGFTVISQLFSWHGAKNRSYLWFLAGNKNTICCQSKAPDC